jgi:hypothetical protein
MPQSGINVGSDARFDILTATGQLSLPQLEKFTSKKITTQSKVRPLNGPPIHLQFPDGWEGSFEVARADGTLDNYFAALEAAQYAGANIASGTIHQTVTNPDGSLSQYMYTDVQLIFKDAGDYDPLKEVRQTVDFVAGGRQQVV